MISMAPSSFTMGASGPAATRATAATMGPKRSSMACTSSIGDGGTGFRFTRRLSHASIAAHGLQAFVGEHLSRGRMRSAAWSAESLLALAPPPGGELEGLHLD